MRHSSTLVLPATAQAPAHVRDALRRTCAHLPPDMLDDVQLLSSELVNNAVQHSASATVTITFASEGNSIYVAVTDQDGSRPGPQRVAHNSESGRGLGLVEVIATAWGIRPLADRRGKVVWFRLGAVRTRTSREVTP